MIPRLYDIKTIHSQRHQQQTNAKAKELRNEIPEEGGRRNATTRYLGEEGEGGPVAGDGDGDGDELAALDLPLASHLLPERRVDDAAAGGGGGGGGHGGEPGYG